jgi:hypothetical protein
MTSSTFRSLSISLAEHRQAGHQADLRPLARADARDGAHQVVFEQALALRRDRRDRLLAIELAHRDAEVELFAGHELLRLDAVELRRVLLLGVGSRVQPFHDDPVARGALELAHQVLDALREAAQRHRHGLALRHVQLHLHRRLEAAQDAARTVGQRVEIALGEVDPRRHARDEEIHRDQDQEQGDQADRRIDQVFVFFHHGVSPSGGRE